MNTQKQSALRTWLRKEKARDFDRVCQEWSDSRSAHWTGGIDWGANATEQEREQVFVGYFVWYTDWRAIYGSRP